VRRTLQGSGVEELKRAYPSPLHRFITSSNL
jgi:hypothetical protein